MCVLSPGTTSSQYPLSGRSRQVLKTVESHIILPLLLTSVDCYSFLCLVQRDCNNVRSHVTGHYELPRWWLWWWISTMSSKSENKVPRLSCSDVDVILLWLNSDSWWTGGHSHSRYCTIIALHGKKYLNILEIVLAVSCDMCQPMQLTLIIALENLAQLSKK